jgi:hypothetical protein
MRLSVCASALVVLAVTPFMTGCGTSEKPASEAQGTKASVVTDPSELAASLPAGQAVVRVANAPTDYAEFAHQYDASVRTVHALGGVIPDGPSYEKCTAELAARVTTGKRARSAPITGILRERYIAECKYRQSRETESVMSTLIRKQWALLAAKQARVSVSDSEVQKAALTDLRENAYAGGKRPDQSRLAVEDEHQRQQILTTRKEMKMKGPIPEATEKELKAQEAQISRTEEQIRGQERTQEREYLQATGTTMTDIRTEATVALLYEKLRQAAIKDAVKASKATSTVQVQELENKAGLDFEEKYSRRWAKKTSCATGFVIGACNNASASSKAEALPIPPRTHQAAEVGGSLGMHTSGPVQVLKVVADPSGAPKLASPSHYNVHSGDVKFEFVNNSVVPDAFALEEAGAGRPVEEYVEFAEQTKTMTMRLEPGEYIIYVRNMPKIKATLTVK